MANHRNVRSKSLLTHQQGKETSAYEFENPHLSRYEWLQAQISPRNGDSSSTEPFILLITRMTGSITTLPMGIYQTPKTVSV